MARAAPARRGPAQGSHAPAEEHQGRAVREEPAAQEGPTGPEGPAAPGTVVLRGMAADQRAPLEGALEVQARPEVAPEALREFHSSSPPGPALVQAGVNKAAVGGTGRASRLPLPGDSPAEARGDRVRPADAAA